MRWTLYNSAGDQAESGFATSSISGTPHILQSPLSQIDVAPKPFTRHSVISFGFPDCFYELKIDQSVLFRHNLHGLVPLTASMFWTLINRFRSDVSFRVSWAASMWWMSVNRQIIFFLPLAAARDYNLLAQILQPGRPRITGGSDLPPRIRNGVLVVLCRGCGDRWRHSSQRFDVHIGRHIGIRAVLRNVPLLLARHATARQRAAIASADRGAGGGRAVCEWAGGVPLRRQAVALEGLHRHALQRGGRQRGGQIRNHHQSRQVRECAALGDQQP